jgi:hypothetical protein
MTSHAAMASAAVGVRRIRQTQTQDHLALARDYPILTDADRALLGEWEALIGEPPAGERA